MGEDVNIPQGRGARSDLKGVKGIVDRGGTEADVAEEHFSDYIRYFRGIRQYMLLKAKPRNSRPAVTTFWGPTGTGKTHSAWELAGDQTVYVVPGHKSSGTYWDGYSQQKFVIIDEMSGARFGWQFLLQLLDERPFTVPVHGGNIVFNSPNIIFCSNSHPRDWYDQTKEFFKWEGGPLQRRLEDLGTIIHKEERYRQPERQECREARVDLDPPVNDGFDLDALCLAAQNAPPLRGMEPSGWLE